MNKIYKVVWSEARNCYVVVSELAKKSVKASRSTAALLAVLVLTAGVGSIAAEAATNGNFTTGTDENGNFTAHIDEENDVQGTAENNYIFGDGNTVANLYDSWIFGNGNSLGVRATDVTGNSIVIGNKNKFDMMFDNSIVLGNNNNSTGNAKDVLVFGNRIELGESTDDSIVIGHSAYNDGYKSVLIGNGAYSNSDASVVLGFHASMGTDAQSSGNSVVIGSYAEIGGSVSNSVAVGSHSRVGDESDHSIAMGYNAQIGDDVDHSIAIGGVDASIGTGAHFSTLLGSYANIAAGSQYATAIGYSSDVKARAGIAIGDYALIDNNSKYSIALGHRAGVNTGAGWSIAVGSSTSVGENAQQSVAIGGYGASVGNDASYATAIGSYSNIADEAEQSTAIGYSTNVDADYGTALGSYSNVSESQGTALGYNTSVTGKNNVALGANSTDVNGVGGYKDKKSEDLVSASSGWDTNNEWLWGQKVKVGDFAGWQAAGGTISVGYKGFERTITNVAAGRIAADSTDAINGSQLYQVAGNLQGQIDELKNDDHYHTVNGNDKETGNNNNTNIDVDGDINNGADNNFDTETGGNTGNSVNSGTGNNPVGDKPELGGGYVPENGNGNLLIKWDTDEAGNKYYDISLNKDLNLDNVNVSNEVNVGNKITVGDKVSITGDTINVGDKVSIKDDSINVGDITINEDNIDMNNNKIINVQEGTAGTDAVNVNQLRKMEQNITNKVNNLDNKVNKVGAGAAALAALHPLDFDPDEKLSFSAGVGHYEDATAAAIGAFYQPNDDTLFSLGGTVGNGEEMVNMGVTFRFGQNSNQSRSKKAMAKEIIELRTEVAELKAMVYSLTNQRFDIYKSAIFPDTPENHWAYDYVAAVAGNGILEGYPSGNFDGNRPMTRYEMAAVVYRLMMQGVEVDKRMMDEFAPELARVRVDTLTNYSDGTPHIQRVRVIEGRG